MPGVLGATNGRDVIVLHPDQSQVQRRCTLAHELAHIDLGHRDGCTDADERAAQVLAARRLIALDALLDAFRWADHLEEIADCLWVDLDTLQCRLDTLSDHERQALVDLYVTLERGA